MTNKELHPKMYIYRRLVEAKLYIDRFYSEKINLDTVSEKGNFSKYHFLRLFKNAFGKSPHAYLTEVRILNAKKLLEENHSIKEVCFDVGFESIPSFIGLFKKYVGITPSRFVKEKNRQNELKQLSPFSFIPNCFAEIHGWIE